MIQIPKDSQKWALSITPSLIIFGHISLDAWNYTHATHTHIEISNDDFSSFREPNDMRSIALVLKWFN